MRHDVIKEWVRLLDERAFEFSLFDTGVCRTVCREILNGETYPLLPSEVLNPNEVKTIADVGANIGAASIYLCDVYPNATVTAFEPCADAYALLVQNTQQFPVVAHNVALGATDGFVDLFHNVEDDVCNSIKNHKSYGHEKVVIERARHHLNRQFDLVKLDTEGMEFEILSDIEAWLKDINVLFIEWHSEDHRHRIDRVLKATHTMWSSVSKRPHRGNVCYVRTTMIPEHYANWAIE